MHSTNTHRRKPAGAPYRQYGALPYRVGGEGRLQVLLITSRETQRWVLPKGWPMKGIRPFRAAEIEAYEEAGAIGRTGRQVIGEYLYFKRLTASFELCAVRVFGLEVDHLEAKWPECHQRTREWFDPETAAELTDEPGLTALIRSFQPKRARQWAAIDQPLRASPVSVEIADAILHVSAP